MYGDFKPLVESLDVLLRDLRESKHYSKRVEKSLLSSAEAPRQSKRMKQSRFGPVFLIPSSFLLIDFVWSVNMERTADPGQLAFTLSTKPKVRGFPFVVLNIMVAR